jgi:membrane protein DedA with SNARE-associated domain
MPDQSALDLIGQWTMNMIEEFGYLGLTLLVALEMVFPPIPSELILPLAGFQTGQGVFLYPLAVLAATIGSVIGSLALYAVGRGFGEHRVRVLIRRWGRWCWLSEQDLDRAQSWFGRYGAATVFLGRMAPGVRSAVSIPAGIARMPLGIYIAYTALGSMLWNAGLIGLGWLLGAAWESATDYVRPLTLLVLAAAATGALILVWKRAGDRLLRRRPERDAVQN